MDIKVITKKAKEIYKELEGLPDDIRLVTFEKLLEEVISSYDIDPERITKKAEAKPKKGKGDKAVIVKRKKGKKAKGRSPESWKIDGSLDLSGGKSGNPLKEIYKEKQPNMNLEKTTVFVHYLIKELGIKNVTYEHIYTCYKHLNQKVPKALKQNVRDIEEDRGWLKLKDGGIVLTTGGENFVELELPADTGQNG